MAWTCDEWPPALSIEGGTNANTICAPASAACDVGGQYTSSEQDFQSNAHAALRPVVFNNDADGVYTFHFQTIFNDDDNSYATAVSYYIPSGEAGGVYGVSGDAQKREATRHLVHVQHFSNYTRQEIHQYVSSDHGTMPGQDPQEMAGLINIPGVVFPQSSFQTAAKATIQPRQVSTSVLGSTTTSDVDGTGVASGILSILQGANSTGTGAASTSSSSATASSNSTSGFMSSTSSSSMTLSSTPVSTTPQPTATTSSSDRAGSTTADSSNTVGLSTITLGPIQTTPITTLPPGCTSNCEQTTTDSSGKKSGIAVFWHCWFCPNGGGIEIPGIGPGPGIYPPPPNPPISNFPTITIGNDGIPTPAPSESPMDPTSPSTTTTSEATSTTQSSSSSSSSGRACSYTDPEPTEGDIFSEPSTGFSTVTTTFTTGAVLTNTVTSGSMTNTLTSSASSKPPASSPPSSTSSQLASGGPAGPTTASSSVASAPSPSCSGLANAITAADAQNITNTFLLNTGNVCLTDGLQDQVIGTGPGGGQVGLQGGTNGGCAAWSDVFQSMKAIIDSCSSDSNVVGSDNINNAPGLSIGTVNIEMTG